MTQIVCGEQADWLAGDLAHHELIKNFGGDYAAEAFADAGEPGALPLIIPAYNTLDADPLGLSRTLASSAAASANGGQRVRPLVVINGHEQGPVPEVVEQFALREGTQFIQVPTRGKTRAIRAGVQLLLDQEGYTGVFATTDDDVVMPAEWPAAVMEHMNDLGADAVGGGTIRYYQVPGIAKSMLLARNAGNALKERQAARAASLRAHGSNMWFSATERGVVARAINEVDASIGYGDDAAIVEAVRRLGGIVLPTKLDAKAQIVTAGDRTGSWSDLVKTFMGRGSERYNGDESWATEQDLSS